MGISFVDAGKHISSALLKRSDIADATPIAKAIFYEYSHNDEIGNYLAIENIAILFEPELKIDLHSILEDSSINKAIFIKSDGVISSNKFSLFENDNTCTINLNGLSYIEI